MNKAIILTLCSFFALMHTDAQKSTQSATDSLLCKKWISKSYELNGVTTALSAEQKGSYMVFHLDSTYENYFNGRTQNGTWHYLPDKKEIRVNDQLEDNFEMILSVEKITPKECILIMHPDKDKTIKMFLEASN